MSGLRRFPHKADMEILAEQLGQDADELLRTANSPDYPGALNGLQFENRGPVNRIAAAVDFSSRVLRKTIECGANFLIVHHGMFWRGAECITGSTYRQYADLIGANVAVYSSHLPLDCHPAIGNNVLLAKELGLEPSGSFARFQNAFIGVSGVTDIRTAELARRADKFARRRGGAARTTAFDDSRQTKRWAICTGSGASAETLREARDAHVDTLIVGEGPHWTAIQAEDNDLTIIYAGHYATETLGVSALAQHLAEKYDLPWQFVNAPTGL
jgi:dinuclear metal center YbgI/SA1388 family protein